MTDQSVDSRYDASNPPTFEHSLAELEGVVHDLEEGQLGLAEALARYEAGVKHLKHCYQLLEAAEQKIELLTSVADDGAARTEPFGEATEPLAESAGRRRRSAKRAAPQSVEPDNRDTDKRDPDKRDIDE